jgi:hypothetical protein
MKVDRNWSSLSYHVGEVQNYQTESSHKFRPAEFDYRPSPEASSRAHMFSNFPRILQWTV